LTGCFYVVAKVFCMIGGWMSCSYDATMSPKPNHNARPLKHDLKKHLCL